MLIYGNSPAVVGAGCGTIFMQCNPDAMGETGQSLVDGIIDNFGDQVMQPFLIGGADVHAGAFSDRLQSFQNLN